MRKHSKTISIAMIKITLSILIFYFISRRITINPLSYLNKNTMFYFMFALACSLILIFLQTLRWQYIVKIFSIQLSYKQCLSAVWVGHLINNLIPAATAGDLVRSYTLRKVDPEQKKWKWISAFLSEKYSAASSALLIASASLLGSISHQLPNVLISLIVILFAGLICTPFILKKIPFLALLQKLASQLTYTFLDSSGRNAFLMSSLINMGMCSIFYVIAVGLGANITLIQCLFVVPVFTLLTSLPISFAGWGIRELSCVGLLQFFGVPTETAIVVSVMYGIVFLLSTVPGIFISYSFFSSKHNTELQEHVKSYS